MKTNKKELLDSFKGGLIVSCQVQHDDPTFSVDFVVKMAKAAQWGGAVGIRANCLLYTSIEVTNLQRRILDTRKCKYMPTDEELNPNTRFVAVSYTHLCLLPYT